MPFHVYILENDKGRFYIGHTSDLARRIDEHNSEDPFGQRYTSKSKQWKIVWKEEHQNRTAAMKREKQIKNMKSAKWIKTNLLNR